MLRNVKDLRGYKICATDGIIGEVDDLYFDDESWTVRYLVVDTGQWLSGRKVLISPLAVSHVDWVTQQLDVSLTMAEVKGSPDIDTRKPVSRQHEVVYFGYYGYHHYWTATASPHDSHLRSCRAVTGHHVHATDGDIGHVEDMLTDDHSWAIRYLVVDTSNWGGGRRVLVAPQWIVKVSWSHANVSIDLTREAIGSAPPYDAAAQLERQLEQGIHEHYGRPGYWITQDVTRVAEPSAK